MSQKLITLWRITLAGTRNFFRNAWLSIASTAVMTVTLSVMLTSVILNFALNDALTTVTQKINVAIYLQDSASQSQLDSLKNDLQKIDNVTAIKFVDKAEALRRYQEQNKGNPALLNAITSTENPLPRSYELTLKDLNNVQPIEQVAGESQYASVIQDTSLGQDRAKTIKRIGDIKAFLLKAGVLGSAVFATIAILIIFNTIRMAIFARKDEVEIMRLIGATNSYIRGPFVFEAMLDGIVAAVFALMIGYVILFVGGPKLLSYIDFSNTLNYFSIHWSIVGLITIGSGILIGVISSTLAMIRYLKL